MKIQEHKLKNGLTVVLVDTEAFPSITTYVSVGAGSRYENNKINGISHFFEHMAFKGTGKFPTAFDISSKIEGMGAVLNASTGKDKTNYYVKAPNDKFTDVIDILSEMILNSKLDPVEIKKEKRVIIEEIKMYEDEPSRMVGEIFDELIFTGNTISMPIAGTIDTVNSLTKESILKYVSSMYHPGNAVISIAGGLKKLQNSNFKVQNYLEIIKDKFGKWDGNIKTPDVNFETNQKKPAIKIKTKKVEQTHMVVGYRGGNIFDKRKYAQSVLGSILGGGMSSKLFIELREKRGLCYYIGTGSDLYKDVGYLYTQAGISNNKTDINESIKIIIDEHTKIAEGKLSEPEFDRAKAHIRGQFLLALEDSRFIANISGSYHLFYGELISIEEILRRMDAVKISDVINLAKNLFIPENLNIALISGIDRDDVQLGL